MPSRGPFLCPFCIVAWCAFAFGNATRMKYVAQGLAGVVAAMLVRIVVMWMDRRRQFPTHPNGEIVHLFLGFVSAVLGALAIPALAAANYTAGVFLGLGATQFHTVRGLESSALKNYDKGNAVPRGPVYIEGLALAFEARNFLIFGVALVTATVGMFVPWQIGFAVGVVVGILGSILLRPQVLRSVCEVHLVAEGVTEPGEAAHEGPSHGREGREAGGRPPDRALAADQGKISRMADTAGASDDTSGERTGMPPGPAKASGEVQSDEPGESRDVSMHDPASEADAPTYHVFSARRFTLEFQPRTAYGKAILRSPAQRQAILHHLHAALGSHLKDTEGHMLTPKARYTDEGVLLVDLWPVLEVKDRALQVAEQVPLLEEIAAPLHVAIR